MPVNYSLYYNDHPDYIALRETNSEFFMQYLNEVNFWKNKYLFELVKDETINTICEVGCATGVLLSRFPTATPLGNRYGVDVSNDNIETAKRDYPMINFYSGYFQDFIDQLDVPKPFDLIILSDILEHVEDDSGLLSLAGKNAKYVALNLPLEKCGEFKDRIYGIEDKHGHLRAYDLQDARNLVAKANMTEEACLVKQYVLEPVFRQYLADKLINKMPADQQLQGVIHYINEMNIIELDPGFYKSNYFALLKNN